MSAPGYGRPKETPKDYASEKISCDHRSYPIGILLDLHSQWAEQWLQRSGHIRIHHIHIDHIDSGIERRL